MGPGGQSREPVPRLQKHLLLRKLASFSCKGKKWSQTFEIRLWKKGLFAVVVSIPITFCQLHLENWFERKVSKGCP